MKTFKVFGGALAALAIVGLGSGAAAQVGQQWVEMKKLPAKLAVNPLSISTSDTEVDFNVGDLDKNGFVDVVAVRRAQASNLGMRTHKLLMNYAGVLHDRTDLFATASDVFGDQGFNTPTSERDLEIVDVDGDTWLDIVTCTTLSDGSPKVISHPRVYMNLGDDGAGGWLGLRFEESRIPQLFTVGGLPVAPRFCGMSMGDLTGDGAPDIYYADYDGTETGIGEPAAWDLNDRLLVNDGNGYFTDESAARLTAAQLQSAFGVEAKIIDLNGDGRMDITKNSTLGSPQAIRAIYQNATGPAGMFQALGTQDFGSGSPYGFDMGNLNNDGLPDLANADDGSDRYRLATGLDPLGRLTWGPLKTYGFEGGGDDGFGHNVHIRDLDGDGWNDVFITSVDVDIPGCSRRTHIYHNRGGVVGGDVTLVEEAQFNNGNSGSGWKGVVGMTAADLASSYDLAFADFDNDGDLDFLHATCSGTSYWENLTAADFCQQDLGFGGPGNAAFSICGEDLTQGASTAILTLAGSAPSSPAFLGIGLTSSPSPFKGGTLVPVPLLTLLALATDGSGDLSLLIPGSSGTPVTLYMQFIVKNGLVYELSNALEVVVGL